MRVHGYFIFFYTCMKFPNVRLYGLFRKVIWGTIKNCKVHSHKQKFMDQAAPNQKWFGRATEESQEIDGTLLSECRSNIEKIPSGWGCTQGLESLPTMCMVLGQIPRTEKKFFFGMVKILKVPYLVFPIRKSLVIVYVSLLLLIGWA